MKTFPILLIFSFLIFRFFLNTNPLVAHDWPLLFSESRDFHPFWAIAWDYMGNGGLGGPAFKTIWIDLYTNFVYFASNSLNIPWWLSQRIFWILPFLSVSIFSSYKLSGLFLKDDLLRCASILIYTFNTYILLILGGGQFGVAFAYALFPLVFASLIQFTTKNSTSHALSLGILTGVLIALDPRIAALFSLAGILWIVFFAKKTMILFKTGILASLVAFLLNSYWLLPIILTPGSLASFSSYSSVAGVKFLSFARLENAMSLLHPNFPENIFGKTYFFRPEFLLIPILAFANLFTKPRKEIFFFMGLGLMALFLGKGAEEPFGQIYLFLFDNIPAFGIFRDSTKFYVLIALSYSILIPYFVESFSKKLRKIFTLAFFVYLLLLLRPVWMGELSGIFNPKPIPREYVTFKKVLKEDKDFYRTLWVPQRSKYGYFDPNHPAIDGKVMYEESSPVRLSNKLNEKKLSELSVRYVVVPTDTDGEIFLKDRKFDAKLYKNTIASLEKVAGLEKVDSFPGLTVFETPSYEKKSAEVNFAPQKWVNIGLLVSALTFIIAFSLLLFGRKRGK